MPRPKKKKRAQQKKAETKSIITHQVNTEQMNNIKQWICDQNEIEYEFHELSDIESDPESEPECNIKQLEKPLYVLLKNISTKMIKRLFKIECEWAKCRYETINENMYTEHVYNHLNEEPQSKCLWNLCTFESSDASCLSRHVDFHAYHTRLKNFGLGLGDVITIPNCLADSKFRNVIPDIPEDYLCDWNGCKSTFGRFMDYVDHVDEHLNHEYAGCDSSVRVKCLWADCERECYNTFALKRHIRTHTKMKMIGCPTCGHLYSNKTYFLEHSLRQVVKSRTYQCTHCLKFYATEKMLKLHERVHVMSYQCTFCGMSCQKKSVLTRHIRYRHITEKSFACEQCEYRGTNRSDLVVHLNTHKTGPLYKCEVFQCNYTSRSLMALKRHDAKEHLGQTPIYQCHCCQKQYARGFRLSKHLKKDHQFALAPGHSRFIYKQDEDGLYRLQTKRVESIINRESLAVADNTEDSDVDVTYEIEKICSNGNQNTVNIQMKKILKRKQIESPALMSTEGDETENSKDINDFEIVKKYKKILSKKSR